jgi:hypothetical protein
VYLVFSDNEENEERPPAISAEHASPEKARPGSSYKEVKGLPDE